MSIEPISDTAADGVPLQPSPTGSGGREPVSAEGLPAGTHGMPPSRVADGVPVPRSAARLSAGAAAFLLCLCVIWGANMLAIKIGNRGFPPLFAAGVRSVGAALLVAIYAGVVRRSVWPSRAVLPHAAAVGALFAGEFFFMYLGLTWTSASRGVVLLYTMPFWAALGAHVLFPDDRISSGKLAGLALSFAGIVAVFGAGAGGLGVSHWAGDLMEVGGALFWALTTLYVKRMGGHFRVGALQVLFFQLVFSAPLLLLLSVIFEAGRAEVVWRWDATLALIHQTLVVATLSYLGWFWLIERYKVSSVSSFTFFTPLFGVLAGGLFLAETLPLLLWVGVIFVAAGVYLVNRAPGPADGAP